MPFYRGNGVAWVLEGGNDTSDATATREDIKLGKTAYIAEGKVEGTSYIAIELTQAQYNALETKDANTYYLIKEEPSYPANVVVFKSDSPRTITPKFTQSGVALQYSIDNGSTWNNISSGETTASSDEIWFRGRATGAKSLYTSSSESNAWVFSGDASNKLHVYGDLRYLLCDNLGDNTITFNIASYCYAFMFYGCTSLTTAPSLPATTLASYCYRSMFSGCTSLTSAPDLPATTLADYCYVSMFSGCTALTSAPALLPATTLAYYCYYSMFYECTALTSAPVLPATALADSCYESMFYGCTALTSAPALPATTLASYCYAHMFRECTALVSPPALPATTLADYCYYYMFCNCTALASAPALPATTLVDSCYYCMFWGCTSLKISLDPTETYQHEWRIPTSGTGTTAINWASFMFTGTGGTYTGDPEINKTYYVENPPVV